MTYGNRLPSRSVPGSRPRVESLNPAHQANSKRTPALHQDHETQVRELRLQSKAASNPPPPAPQPGRQLNSPRPSVNGRHLIPWHERKRAGAPARQKGPRSCFAFCWVPFLVRLLAGDVILLFVFLFSVLKKINSEVRVVSCSILLHSLH